MITGGYNAEYGRATGGTVNVITKRGGNEFHGSVFGHFSPALLASDAATIRREGSAIDARIDTGNAYDAGAEVGGPIVIDRLWFHAGFAPHVTHQTTNRIISQQVDDDQDGIPDIDGATGFTVHNEIASRPLAEVQRTYFFTAKLTGAVDENHRGEIGVFGNPGTSDELTYFGMLRAPAALMWRREVGSYNAIASWTSKLAGGATELAARAGFHRTYERLRDYDDRPVYRYNYQRSLADFADVEGINLDACNDTGTGDPYPRIANCPVNGYAEQGLGVVSDRRDDRTALTLAITHRVKLGGYHVLKAGVDAERASDATAYHATGGFALTRGGIRGLPWVWRLVEAMRVTRNLTAEERANPSTIVLGDGEEVCPNRDAICVLQDPVHTSASAANVGTYVQDSWLVTRSLTLAAGLRWDHQVGEVADGVTGTISPEGERIGERVFELDNFAPRAGVVYDPTGQGLAKMFAHVGRFYETLPLTASDLYANTLFTSTLLNVDRLRPGRRGYDPNCHVDHGAPDLAETVRSCTDREPRGAFKRSSSSLPACIANIPTRSCSALSISCRRIGRSARAFSTAPYRS